MNQSRTPSFHYRKLESDSPRQPWSGDFDFDGSDRRFAFSRQSSFQQSAEHHTPASILTNDSAKALLTRTVSSIDIPPNIYPQDAFGKLQDSDVKFRVSTSALSVFRGVMSGNKQMRRLFMLISLNVAYSTAELCIGLLSGQVGLVSDAFHLTFGCGLLTFSLFAMAASREKPDRIYTYGYKRLEVLSAFTNALFLLFLSFSLAVEALHAFIQDESEHKNYARINLVYRKAEDMNYHAVCLHVLADSIRSAGLILASWLLTLGVKNAEVLCLGLVSAIVFFLVMPLFRATGGILLQMAPPRIPSSALGKCLRQVSSREDVSEVSQARFWELVPGHVIGSILLQVKEGVDDRPILQYVHELYHELGIQDLTVQIDYT
ncbi:PREDICTED: metal tolerance protein C2 isoform X2 [Nicotiana attenuata]|uniref:metal tolerance protein C2 isoform X2 n=1 Tax=Nicotiana attenuata TaxID=49451 RepID=UPI000905CFD9|nr:PREDICTED: metal tolerance protein C2 isoform X2 [Nicotiana attenuata]